MQFYSALKRCPTLQVQPHRPWRLPCVEHHPGLRVSRPPHGELVHQLAYLLLGGDLLQEQDVQDAALRPRVQQPRMPVCAGERVMRIMSINNEMMKNKK